MKRHCTALIIPILVFILAACSSGDIYKSPPTASLDPYVYPTSKMTGEEAMELQTPMPSEYYRAEFVVKPVEMPEDKESITVSDYNTYSFKSLEELFVMGYTAVYGKVIDVEYLEITFTYKDAPLDPRRRNEPLGSETLNYAKLTFEVYENYSDRPLKYTDGNNITIMYQGATAKRIKSYLHMFEPNDECILIIAQSEDILSCFPDRYTNNKDYFEQFPYEISFSFTDAWVMVKEGDMFNAFGLMKVKNGEEYNMNTETGLMVEYYPKSEIDAVIKANIDNMKGYSYYDMYDGRYGPNEFG